ncbi:MAG: hypothetical protein ACYDDE_00420 [bacterium]
MNKFNMTLPDYADKQKIVNISDEDLEKLRIRINEFLKHTSEHRAEIFKGEYSRWNINWSDLHCSDISYNKNIKSIDICIEEASPDNNNFKCYIETWLKVQFLFGKFKDININIETEW